MKEDIKVPYLMYNAMFKSVFRKNPNVLKRLVELVLEENDIHLNLEDSDEGNIILDAIEKINAKQEELRKRIKEL